MRNSDSALEPVLSLGSATTNNKELAFIGHLCPNTYKALCIFFFSIMNSFHPHNNSTKWVLFVIPSLPLRKRGKEVK